ncbi:Nn.00g106900.m01.CDS01 [Neocucurbitaria sp. VM-36]
MAAATAGYEWNRSSPLRSSPDTSSSMYPDRPIRPLPKRSLRARLSPEQAEAIEFPNNPPSTGPLFNFPYSASERGNRALRTGENDHHACHCGHTHSEVESEEEEDERNGPLPSSPSYQYSRHLPGKSAGGAAGAYAKPGSTASSVDGYESFENTNNKKKRKIPNMGSNSSHHANLSADLASMGIAHAHEAGAIDDGDGPGRYYGSAPATPQHNTNSGTGISGAGRGRFGRSGSGRSERRVLGASTNLANAKASSKRPPEQSGIISTAIANAQATPPPHGNENVSLLQQEAAKNSANKTQFTFTCGSDSANKMVWPGQENGPYPQPPGAYPAASAAPPSHPQAARARPPVRPDAPMVSTQGTQTSPDMNGAATYPPSANRNAPPQKGAQSQQQAPPPPKPRRSASKLYAYAARKRRIQQEYANFHSPPSQPWICEFCEYEDIFGHQPKALIRQYEMKDRKERKRLAEKRRLLEKARMKGRKGKKASKKAQNSANNTQHAQNPPPGGYDRHPDDGSLDPQDDEYYDDDGYDDVSSGPPTQCRHGCQHHAPLPGQKMARRPDGDPMAYQSVANCT